MFKLLIGFIAGVFTGFGLGLALPAEIFIATCIVLTVLAVLLFYIFHLGLRDFQ